MSKSLEILVKHCNEKYILGFENRELCFLDNKNYALCEHTGARYITPHVEYLRCNRYKPENK